MSWHAEIYDVVKSAWPRFEELDLTADLEYLREWLRTAFSSAPPTRIEGPVVWPLPSGLRRRGAADVLFVGFDSGDLICIGALTSDGLGLSRDRFDFVGGP